MLTCQTTCNRTTSTVMPQHPGTALSPPLVPQTARASPAAPPPTAPTATPPAAASSRRRGRATSPCRASCPPRAALCSSAAASRRRRGRALCTSTARLTCSMWGTWRSSRCAGLRCAASPWRLPAGRLLRRHACGGGAPLPGATPLCSRGPRPALPLLLALACAHCQGPGTCVCVWVGWWWGCLARLHAEPRRPPYWGPCATCGGPCRTLWPCQGQAGRRLTAEAMAAPVASPSAPATRGPPHAAEGQAGG